MKNKILCVLASLSVGIIFGALGGYVLILTDGRPRMTNGMTPEYYQSWQKLQKDCASNRMTPEISGYAKKSEELSNELKKLMSTILATGTPDAASKRALAIRKKQMENEEALNLEFSRKIRDEYQKIIFTCSQENLPARYKALEWIRSRRRKSIVPPGRFPPQSALSPARPPGFPPPPAPPPEGRASPAGKKSAPDNP